MIVGFTGTRRAITEAQRDALVDLVQELEPIAEIHHGDCVGADAAFHRIAANWSGCRFVVHPPDQPALRARMPGDLVLPPKPYLERDADIVAASDVVIACPYERAEQRRSGTWATVRMARRAGVSLALVYPDGEVVRERWGQLR